MSVLNNWLQWMQKYHQPQQPKQYGGFVGDVQQQLAQRINAKPAVGIQPMANTDLAPANPSLQPVPPAGDMNALNNLRAKFRPMGGGIQGSPIGSGGLPRFR